ncbi:peptide deformylase [Enorma sp.]|uniref:peptide deformylase n=1 Tax=Enorma sp. TaxID=1920692 RepID=UPI0025C33902|nr:peptide deformylase [Enorma sp.]
MIKDIVKDRDFLSKPAEPATAEDAEVAEDLRDTIESLEDCVCLAANQIGSNKAIIAYEDNGRIAVMFNPKIKMAAQPYQTQESCLSLEEVSEVKRFQMISVGYQVISNGNLVSRTKRLSGWTAELVQHGIDHCAGKLV